MRFEFGDKVLWIGNVATLSQGETWLEVVTDDIASAAAHFERHGCICRDDIEPLPNGFHGFWLASPANIIHLVGGERLTRPSAGAARARTGLQAHPARAVWPGWSLQARGQQCRCPRGPGCRRRVDSPSERTPSPNWHSRKRSDGEMRAIADLISLLRLLSAVPLLWLAWTGRPTAFLILLLLAVLSDAADGWFARRAAPVGDDEAPAGARLDSYADYTMYLVVPVGAWWLWPELIAQEALWVALAVLGYALPGALAIARFGRPAAFHTWAAKAAVAVVAPALMLLFAGGPGWPLRVGAIVALVAGLEQCAMIHMAPGPREQVPSLWHARRIWHGQR